MCIRDRFLEGLFALRQQREAMLNGYRAHLVRAWPVSYTHLDVYKRQVQCAADQVVGLVFAMRKHIQPQGCA